MVTSRTLFCKQLIALICLFIGIWGLGQFSLVPAVILNVFVFLIYLLTTGYLGAKLQKVQAHASLLEHILDHMPFAIYVKDPGNDYRCSFFNKTVVDFSCNAPEMILGSSDEERGATKEEAAVYRRYDEEVMKSGALMKIEGEAVNTPKGYIFTRTTKAPMYTETGEALGLLLILEDMTKEKKTRDLLRDFEAAIKRSEDSIIIMNPDGNGGATISYVNDAFTNITGYAAEEVLGQSPKLFDRLGDLKNVDPITEAMRKSGKYRGEVLSRRKDGSDFWQSLSVYALLDETGKVKNYVSVGRDITEQKKKEEELDHARTMKEKQQEILFQKERAEAANHAKSEFLASMSHELRTPLNSIIGMSKLLLDTSLDSEQRDSAVVLSQSATHLLDIVNDILDLSKIEANEVRLERIGFDLQTVLSHVMSTMAPLAANKKLTLAKDYLDVKFPYVLGDPTRLSRVLTNLIGNAIKYTDHGYVQVKALFDDVGQGTIRFTCKVIDSGIGIPEEKLDSIFQKFVQADTSTTRKYGGTGLGLAITKQLVELMGGTVNVTSKAGQGSTFWITIPFSVTESIDRDLSETHKRQALGTLPVNHAHVLVAEDHPMNQILMTKLMKSLGFQSFKIVANGHEALEAYKSEKWDVILMDVHMPEMSGFEATSAIRVLEKLSDQHVPIVALTADAMTGDREKCLRFDMDDYISKPINTNEMKDVLGQWIKMDLSEEELAAPEPAAAPVETIDDLLAPKPVDLVHLRSFTNGNEAAEKDLIQVFVEQSDLNIVSLIEHCVDGEDKPWGEAAHMFKGGAAAIGAVHLADLCYIGQKQLDVPLAERQKLLEEIRAEYEIVKDYLRKINLLE